MSVFLLLNKKPSRSTILREGVAVWFHHNMNKKFGLQALQNDSSNPFRSNDEMAGVDWLRGFFKETSRHLFEKARGYIRSPWA